MVLWRPYRALEKATHHGGLRGRNDDGRARHFLVLSRDLHLSCRERLCFPPLIQPRERGKQRWMLYGTVTMDFDVTTAIEPDRRKLRAAASAKQPTP